MYFACLFLDDAIVQLYLILLFDGADGQIGADSDRYELFFDSSGCAGREVMRWCRRIAPQHHILEQ
jgi:hypothetical protein